MPISSAPIQQAIGAASVGTTVVVTLPGSSTTGNTLIACIGGNNTPTVASIAGGGVTTWAKAVSSNTQRVAEIWYGVVTAGAVTAVTVTFGGTLAANTEANVSEWSGVLTTGTIVDASGSNTGGATATATTATIATSDAGDLLIACTRPNGGKVLSSGPTDSFTALTTGTDLRSAYRLPGATGSYSTSWTWTTSGVFDAEIAAFFPAAGGGATWPGYIAPFGWH